MALDIIPAAVYRLTPPGVGRADPDACEETRHHDTAELYAEAGYHVRSLGEYADRRKACLARMLLRRHWSRGFFPGWAIDKRERDTIQRLADDVVHDELGDMQAATRWLADTVAGVGIDHVSTYYREERKVRTVHFVAWANEDHEDPAQRFGLFKVQR